MDWLKAKTCIEENGVEGLVLARTELDSLTGDEKALGLSACVDVLITLGHRGRAAALSFASEAGSLETTGKVKVESLHAAAKAHFANDHLFLGVKTLKEALSLVDCNDDSKRAEVMETLVTAHILAEGSEEVRATRAAVEFFQELGQVALERDVPSVLNMHAMREHSDESVQLALKSVAVSRKAWKNEQPALLKVVGLLSQEPGQALKLAEESLALFRKLTHKRREAEALILVGGVHLATGDAGDAVKAGEESAALFQELNDVEGMMAALRVITLARLATNDGASALRAAETLRDSLNATSDGGDFPVTRAIVSILVATGRTVDALAALDEVRAQRKAAGDVRGEISVLYAVMEIQMKTGALADVLLTAQELQDTVRGLGDQRSEGECLNIIANISLKSGKTKNALRVAHEALSLLELDMRGQVDVLRTVVHCTLLRSDYDAAIDAARRVVRNYQELGDKRGEAVAHNLVARALLQKEHPRQALKSASEGRSLFQQLGDGEGEVEILHTVVHAHIVAGAAVEAMNSAAELRSIARAFGPEREAAACNVMASSRLSSKEAFQAATDAKALYRKLGDKVGEAIALHTLARVQFARKQASAFDDANRAAALFNELGDPASEAAALMTVAQNSKNTESGIRAACLAATGALNIYQRLGDDDGVARASQLLQQAKAPHHETAPKAFLDDSGIAVIELDGSASAASLAAVIAMLQSGVAQKSTKVILLVINAASMAEKPSSLTNFSIRTFLAGLRSVGAPIVCAAWGRIAGSIWNLFFSTDYRIASHDSTFLMPAVSVLKDSNAATLCMRGPVSALTMLEMGILHTCQPGRNQVKIAAVGFARRLASPENASCRRAMFLMAEIPNF